MTIAPLVLLLAFFTATTLPLLAVGAAAASPWIPGRWRPLRLLWFSLVFLAVESAGLIGALGLWIASGFGRNISSERFQAAHYKLMAWYAGVIVRVARRTFNVTIEIDDLGPDGRHAMVPTEPRVPILVFSRHAGAGDSFLLVHGLLTRDRRPRVVLKSALQWAPCLDAILNRVPSHFVAPKGGGPEDTAAIARLAGGLGSRDALVIFPEGGNFSSKRRHRSISKLESMGLHAQADQARQMRHVLAPRPGGALAAIAAAPTADVLFVAHTGLEDLSTIVDLWRGLPMDAAVGAKVWRVLAADIPGPEERAAWLYEWWLRIDAWIIEHRGQRSVPDAVADAVLEEGAAPPA
ncbi:MAG TPA: 1-acyl-sn-glycerol-3-phosphate acyltransferase [Egibacteraceae bacterium]|nr:1-acyl-sn-glycerol-3-phosphate acyltransferase [Egibacteraceae bacterium]